MKLSIVILNYQTPDLTISCVESIQEHYQEELKNKDFEIIIVDNSSKDDSLDKLKLFSSNKDYLRVVDSELNLGFAKGCNLGASKAQGEYLLFLNSDTNVLDKGIIKMVDFLKQNANVGILGGRLRNSDGSLQPSAGVFYNLPNLIIMLLGVQRFGLLKSSPNKIKKVDWVSGAALMILRKAFEELHGFDEDYFMYIEDMDLSYRARKKGILTYFFPDVSIKHVGEGSSSRTFAVVNIYKNILMFYKKQMGEFSYTIAYFCLFLKAIFVYTIGKLSGNSYFQNTYGETFKLFR